FTTAAHSFATLTQGERVNGFRTISVYLNAAGEAMGARFVHEESSFTLDLLQIQSAPQALIWVNTKPVSDRGEPHTQEHLLLAKGSRGRELESAMDMSLATSNAFTQQLRTIYQFNTVAGADVFYKLLDQHLKALLDPDYTDEEIRREVRNFGITTTADGKTLSLEEKGSVYNEMVSSSRNQGFAANLAIRIMLYGKDHPLSFVSGGLPSGIRELKPSDIRSFHDANYHLWNMGMIGCFPKEMALDDVLGGLNQILSSAEPAGSKHSQTGPALPAGHPAPAGASSVVDYPEKNQQQAGLISLAWPAAPPANLQERLLLELFIENLSSGATSNLYRRLVDSKTREVDLGISGVSGYVADQGGYDVSIGLAGMPPSNITSA
ncbi:MAG: hypothetical protein ACREDR_43780, partial [Blastocatellia bacterium]